MSAPPHSPPPPAIVKNLMLSPLLGTFVTMVLYGATSMQTYQYFDNFGREDSSQMKALVAFIFVLETVAAGLNAYHTEFFLIQHFGQPEYMAMIQWSLRTSVCVGFIIAWAVNQFFVRRIYVLSRKNLWLSIVIGILATIRPAFGFTASALASIHPDWVSFKEHAQWVMITGLSIGLLVDGLIAFCVSYHLAKNRNTINHKTRNIINALLAYTVNTGAILTFFAAVELFGLIAYPKTLIFLGLFQVQVQLYANCFLTNLNARQSLRRDNTPMVTLSGDRMKVSHNRSQPSHHAVEVKTDTFVSIDGRRSLDKARV